MDDKKFRAEIEEIFKKGEVKTYTYVVPKETCLNMEARWVVRTPKIDFFNLQ